MRPRQRRNRRLAAALAALVLLAVASIFVLPPIIKSQLQAKLGEQLGRAVTVGKVRVNPFALSLTLENLDVREKGGPGSFAGWRRLYARFDALRSLGGDWVLADVELDGFHADVTLNPDGSFNFSDLIAKFAPAAAPPSKPGRPLRVTSLAVTDTEVRFADLTLRHPFRTVVGPLSFTLTGFRTAGSRGAPYHFGATTEAGESLDWEGTLAADPVSSRGAFKLGGIVMKKYSPYFEGLSRTDLYDGVLGLEGSYVVNLDPAARTLQVSGVSLHASGLKVVERAGGKPVLGVGALDVSGLSADAVAMSARVDRVSLSKGTVSLRRESDGSVNLVTLLRPANPTAPPAAPAPRPAASPSVSIGEVAVDSFNVDVVDNVPAHPAHFALGSLQASLKGFTLAQGASMPLHVSFGWAPKGTVLVDGSVSLGPVPKADLKATVNRFELLPLSPYVEQYVNARITEGAVSTISTVHLSIAGASPSVSLTGDLSVDKFGLVDGAHDRELAGFSWFAIAGLSVATDPRLAVSMKQVDIDGPYARVRVNPDKSVNLLDVMRPAGARSRPTAAPAPAPLIQVGRVAVDGGDFSFSDQSIDPAVHVSLVGFGGSVSGLSSENLARADVDLKGMVGGVGPVAISGKLDPLGARKFVGLKVEVRNVDLLPLSPYLGRYAGYDLARGQLVVDSNILVDGEKVDATNVVTLNQFTFGSPTSSPDATGLPVRLGVSLLKDIDGRIVIDLPVQGTLGDPNFRIGKVVLRVIVNLLTKAAVSPFALVGSMFGGGGEELAFQEFEPGSSALKPAEVPKLATLSKVLVNRPALSLGLEGDYDAAADSYALRRARLADLVRRSIWEERHAADPNIAPPEQLQISAAESAAMTKRLFDAKFPPGTTFGTPLPAEPAAAPPPSPPPAGLIARIVNIVTFRAQRDEKAARAQADRREAEHRAAVQSAVASGLPLDQMTGRLAESIPVAPDDLAALAASRAQSVRDYLATTGKVPVERLFLSKAAAPGKPDKGPRVFLSLQ